MDDSRLKKLLISRVMDSCLPQPFLLHRPEGQITRRQFLIGTSAVGTLSFLGNIATDEKPKVYRSGRKVVVSYRGATWEVNPDLFGRVAKAGFRRENASFRISLKNATLVGTDLSCDFLATLSKSSRGWEISISIPELGFGARTGLDGWIKGIGSLDGIASLRKIQFGGMRADLPENVALAVTSEFKLIFGKDNSVLRISDPLGSTCQQLVFFPQLNYIGSLHDQLGEKIDGPLTRFNIERPHYNKVQTLSSNVDGRCFTFEPRHFISCSGEACNRNPSNSSVLIIEGSGAFGVDGFGSHEEGFQRIQLQRAALILSTGLPDEHAIIAGKISNSKHSFDFGHWVATLSGSDEKPFYARFRGGTAHEISIFGKLHSLTIPVKDAEASTLTVLDQPLEIKFPIGSQTFANNRSRICEAQQANEFGSSLFIVGREPLALVSLESARINIRRGVDLFNLGYSFTGFDLKIRQGLPILRRRRPKKKNHDWPEASVAVHFPPQHIAEEWWKVQNPSSAMPAPPNFPTTARARLSGPSRIVFKVPGKFRNPKWIQRPLTIACLTEWSDLALSVNCRAAEGDLSSEALLKLSGIESNDSLKKALDKVAATYKPPEANETSLEMTGRLLFSPAQSAGWITPTGPVNPSEALLWSARLDDVGRQNVRAIWSRMMLPGSFADACQPMDINVGGNDPRSLLVLTGDDHRQIVTLTSIYGLIALRRLPPDPSKLNESQGKLAENLPKSRIIRPSERYQSLVDADEIKQNKDSGFALPTTFADANIILTSLGGTIDAEWHGEPFNIPFNEKDKENHPELKWPRSLSLERFGYRSQLGRDIRIDVEKKGFLIPLGHRATHVTLTERRFFKHPEYGYPVAYLVQRTFIVVKSPEKSFPAIYQPFDSRDFPVNRVVMLTKSTPDLVPLPADKDPNAIHSGPVLEELTGRVRVEGLPNTVLVLWARLTMGTPGSAGDFKFKWSVDNDEVPFASSLLFVENSALSSERIMKGIADYYRSQTPFVRTAKASGSRRRYAESEKAGDTSFNTDSWVLSIRGRLLPAEVKNSGSQPSETEAFMMDGRMEGADQPPLYPFVERGRITIQSLDRLVGSPQGLIDVSFNNTYLRRGFNTSENKSEIYLNVLGPDIKLDVTGNGNSTGGLAKPNTLVAALSRRIGIVGGLKKPAELPKNEGAISKLISGVTSIVEVPVAEASSLPTPESPYDFPNAQKGKFDPKEFLGGIANTKLLGLIELKQVLSAIDIDGAPQLLEKIGYGAEGATGRTALVNIQEIAKMVLPPIQKGVCNFLVAVGEVPTQDSSCKPANDQSILPKGVAFRDLYPVLDQRLQAFDQTLVTALPSILKAVKITDIAEPVSDLASDGSALLAEIERTLRDPVPRVIEADITLLSTAWDELRNLINKNYFEIGKKLRSEVIGQSITAFCHEVGKNNLSSVLFGTNEEPTNGAEKVTCDMIVENPAAALTNVENALFSQVFAGQLADLLVYLRSYEAEVTGRIAFDPNSISPSIFLCIRTTAEELRTQLTDEGVNILEQRGQEKLTNAVSLAIISAVNSAINNLPDIGNADGVKQILEVAEKASGNLDAQISSAIDQNRDLFKSNPPSQIQAILQVFKKQAIPAIEESAKSAVKAKTGQVRQLLLTRLQATRADAIQRLLGAFQRIVASMAKTAIFIKVAQAGSTLQGWCNSGNQVVDFADNFAGGLLGATMSSDLLEIAQNAQALSLPSTVPLEILDRFARIRRSILIDAQQLAVPIKATYATADDLHLYRTQVDKTKSINVCNDPGKLLNLVSNLLQFRRDAIGRTNDLLTHVVNLESLGTELNQVVVENRKNSVHSISPSVVTELDASLKLNAPRLDEMVARASSILAGTTSIGQANLTKTWSAIESNISLLQSSKELGKVPEYVNSLNIALKDLLSSAKQFRDKLNDPKLTAAKLQAIGEAIAVYAKEQDKRVAGLVLQSVALTDELSRSLGLQIANALSTTAGIFLVLHQACSKLLEQLLTLLADPIVSQVINPNVLLSFTNVKKEVDLDQDYLRTIKDSGTDPTKALEGSLRLLGDRWKISDLQSPPLQAPALVRAVEALSDLVDHFLRGDLASIVRLPDMRQALDQLSQQLRELASQLLPTRVDLSYAWKTGLGNVPEGKDPIFKLTAPKSSDDLTIDAKVSVDFISGARSATITGTLKPFEIHLLGALIDIVTIKFKGATFNSRNGSAPEFKADIQEVVLGTVLEFLRPLQAWMSPSGDSGPYVKPILLGGSAGIEAGYIYDAGLIQVGTLQFINVALGVAARLPFGNQPAELSFSFASPERPFLISQPPYGGGGYLRLVSTAQGITEFSMSLMFGAVVSIKFGPLKAHGRVTAGIFIQTGPKGHVIRAFVEAVGEGNIACFSICVSIQVGLQDESANGTLTGYSIFSVSFKIGFVTLNYSVRATYTIKGGNDSSSKDGALGAQIIERPSVEFAQRGHPDKRDSHVILAKYQTGTGTEEIGQRDPKPGDDSNKPYCEDSVTNRPLFKGAPRILNKVPRRATQWAMYQKRISMHLLKD
jgi:hypothetical protein